MKPCEHCANPDRALWQTECRYKGLYPSHRAFALTTFDPPCALAQYDEDMRQISRGQNILAVCVTLCVAALLAVIFIGLKHL